MGKIYMIGSQKGGVGKTTTTLNLAYSLQAAGKRVLMVDFDSQANLTTCFGLENTGELENTIGHLMVMTMEDEEVAGAFREQIPVYESRIPQTVKVGEANYYSEPLMMYAPESNACTAYQDFAKELMTYES